FAFEAKVLRICCKALVFKPFIIYNSYFTCFAYCRGRLIEYSEMKGREKA
ncbi:8515_t:CDS:2, partial [Acaulospora morrowiae]